MTEHDPPVPRATLPDAISTHPLHLIRENASFIHPKHPSHHHDTIRMVLDSPLLLIPASVSLDRRKLAVQLLLGVSVLGCSETL